jgi:hypothetical protein
VPHAYDVVLENRSGIRRVVRFTSEEPLQAGEVIRLSGRYWVVEDAAPGNGNVLAKPARYRIRLRHPDGREEVGAFRRFRVDAPGIGHAFATVADGRPESWQIVDRRIAHDDAGGPYVEFVAERDFTEVEELPDHELEHALARSLEQLPPEAVQAFDRAAAAGLALELVALEPGKAPDWAEAERFIDALVLEEIEDDLLELCGVDPDRDPREHWLAQVQERLRTDLASFRDDVEGDHDEIEEWDYLDGSIFASVGSTEDEANPDAAHGWLVRLVDAGALGAAGFTRVRKAELDA